MSLPKHPLELIIVVKRKMYFVTGNEIFFSIWSVHGKGATRPYNYTLKVIFYFRLLRNPYMVNTYLGVRTYLSFLRLICSDNLA